MSGHRLRESESILVLRRQDKGIPAPFLLKLVFVSVLTIKRTHTWESRPFTGKSWSFGVMVPMLVKPIMLSPISSEAQGERWSNNILVTIKNVSPPPKKKVRWR